MFLYTYLKTFSDPKPIFHLAMYAQKPALTKNLKLLDQIYVPGWLTEY